WEEWQESFRICEAACEYTAKPKAARKALLLHVLGPQARRIATTFPPQPVGATTEDTGDPGEYILDKFDELYQPYKNVIQAAALFNSMVQAPGQTIDDFVTELRRQAQRCDFGDKCDRLVGDRIVVGIRDAALRERLFRERNLSLDKIISACKAVEISKKQYVKELTLRDLEPEVNAIRKHSQKTPRQPGRPQDVK
ncbi:unnamed protein product, partial [Ixodes persulcatus]